MNHPTPYTPHAIPIDQAMPRPAPVHPTLAPEVRGVQWVILPDGTRTLAYTTNPDPGPTPPPPAAPTRSQSVPAWAKTTALLVPTGGLGITAAGHGISLAADGVAAMTPALWATAALIATGGLAAALRGLGRRSGTRTPHITQHIHATGLFSRASGTVNGR